MSRIGNKPVVIPEGVEVTIKGRDVIVKNGKTELTQTVHPKIDVELKDNEIVFSRKGNDKESAALHGLMRSLVQNAVTGVKEGFSKSLIIEGIGYRAQKQGKTLVMNLGLSHPVEMEEPEGIEFEVPAPNKVIVKGADKQLVGEMAAKICATRVPDPYKGHGIRYEGQILRLKEGKTGA